jgi:hypothetical protein
MYITQVEQTTQRKIKQDNVKYNDLRFIVAIEVDGERFHNNSRVGF